MPKHNASHSVLHGDHTSQLRIYSILINNNKVPGGFLWLPQITATHPNSMFNMTLSSATADTSDPIGKSINPICGVMNVLRFHLKNHESVDGAACMHVRRAHCF